jgi:tetraacyldisaccharide 4'-kinase
VSVILRIISVLLFPLLIFYTFIIYLRLKLYDWNIFKTCAVEAPVISVGNIQIGGTGKTPLVEFLAENLVQWGNKPAILTRGYGRKDSTPLLMSPQDGRSYSAEKMGDEPLLLSRNVKNSVLMIDSDRCRGAETVLSRTDASVLLLDDGFQHRRISRNMNIALIDVQRWSSWPLLFPLTSFRDVQSSLKNASCVMLTHSRAEPEKTRKVKKWLKDHFNFPVYDMNYIPTSLINVRSGEKQNADVLVNAKVACFCGIAHPGQFYTMVSQMGSEICWQKSYRDHHRYREEDLQYIQEESVKSGAEMIITTQKDAVKLEEHLPDNAIPVYYVTIGCEIDNRDQFLNDVKRVIGLSSGSSKN